MNNRLKISVALELFKDLMDANQASNEWCIVGSMALRVLGGIAIEPHDIDVEVLENTNMENTFRNMAISYGSNNHERKNDDYDMRAERVMRRPVTWKHKPYIFEIRGVKVNVWIVSEFSNRYVQLANGLKYALPMDILDRKLAYGRSKDMAFGCMLIQGIVTMMNRYGTSEEKK